MNKHVFLLGCGGHGRVVLDALLESGNEVHSILDPGQKAGDTLFGVPVGGQDDVLENTVPGQVLLANGLGANPYVAARKNIYLLYKDKGFIFASVRHPSVVVGRECSLDEGVQLMAGVVIQNRTKIGVNTVVNTRVSIDHDCSIAQHCFLGPGAVLCGNVVLEDEVFVGAGAVLLPGVQIGKGSIIGAGAVVTRNVSEASVVRSVPATVKKIISRK